MISNIDYRKMWYDFKNGFGNLVMQQIRDENTMNAFTIDRLMTDFEQNVDKTRIIYLKYCRHCGSENHIFCPDDTGSIYCTSCGKQIN